MHKVENYIFFQEGTYKGSYCVIHMILDGLDIRGERIMALLEHSYFWPKIEDNVHLYVKTNLVY